MNAQDFYSVEEFGYKPQVANGNVRAALIEAEAALDRKAVKYA